MPPLLLRRHPLTTLFETDDGSGQPIRTLSCAGCDYRLRRHRVNSPRIPVRGTPAGCSGCGDKAGADADSTGTPTEGGCAGRGGSGVVQVANGGRFTGVSARSSIGGELGLGGTGDVSSAGVTARTGAGASGTWGGAPFGFVYASQVSRARSPEQASQHLRVPLAPLLRPARPVGASPSWPGGGRRGGGGVLGGSGRSRVGSPGRGRRRVLRGCRGSVGGGTWRRWAGRGGRRGSSRGW